MRSRVLGGIVVAIALIFGSVIASPFAPQASALSPGVHFSADNLPTWQTNGVVYGLAHSHGKVVAGGTFSQIRPPNGGAGTPQTRNGLAVFNAETGQPDSCQFSIALSGGTPTVRTVVASPDGNTIYVGGNFSNIGGASVLRVAALDVQTCTVRAFRANAVSSFVFGMATFGNILYIAGEFQSVAGQQRLRFAALDATTGALLPWTANADRIGRAVAVSPDGSRVAIGGDFFTINGQNSHSIAVVSAGTGGNIRNYPVGFIPQTSVTKSLYSSGGSFYGGNEGTGGGVFDGRFAIDWNTLEQRWRDNCLGATQAVLEYQGTLYSASHAHDCASNGAFQDGKRNFFMAQRADTAELLGWDPPSNDGTGEGIGPRALTIATGASTGQPYLWAGGEFTTINLAGQQGLTRFSPADTRNPPVPVVSAQATSSGTVQVRFRTVVDSDDSVLTYRVFRNGSTTPIWTGTANSVWWKRPQVSVVDGAVTPGTTYSYRVTASDGTNTSGLSAAVTAQATGVTADYPARVRADRPQFYWQYDGTTGTWVQDKSAAVTKTDGLSGIAEQGVAHANDGAFAGDTTGSGLFDDTNDYLWEDNYAPGPSTYTIETWIKTTTTTGGKIVGYGNGRPLTHTGATVNSGSYDRHIYMDNSGRLTFGVYTGSAVTIRSAAAYNNGAWHHVVATQGSAGMALYVDGVRVGQNSQTTAQSYWGVWRVGGDNLNGWPNRPSTDFFGGQIDETAIYNTALTNQQVLNHYAPTPDTVAPSTPTGVAATNNGNSATVSWTASTDNVGVAGYSVYRGTSAGFTADAASRIAQVTSTSYTDSGLAPGGYFYKVTAADVAGNSSGVSAASNQVTVAPTADTTAPSVPAGVSTSVNQSTVTVNWTASTDNVGVSGYTIHRGTTSGFTANGANQIGTSTAPSFANSGVPAGTWYYRVVARDAAGNASAASTAASATVTASPGQPITVPVNPSDDAMVFQANAGTNYGNDQQLSARGTGTSLVESFLRFTLPSAPSGYALSSATMSVRTSTDPAANSVDTFTFAVVGGAWTEAGITWTNRPTTAQATLGTLSGTAATNSPYSSNLSIAAVSPLLGQTVSVRLASNGADNLRLWSTEAPSTAYRPVLSLTFTPIG
ncbi:LamG-like jellyroll fold domain-containing protein [Mycetocola zhadangensis]|uniref:LamG-like jellyroll fold domain-containing protein n=1 Tax=Mycetocola zhadangensis TaxID=1164595 RepID=UPI003A4E0899